MITLDEQIKEIEREIELRIAVYKNRIERGLMKRENADKHMENIRAVLKTLHWLKDNEARIKAKVDMHDDSGKAQAAG